MDHATPDESSEEDPAVLLQVESVPDIKLVAIRWMVRYSCGFRHLNETQAGCSSELLQPDQIRYHSQKQISSNIPDGFVLPKITAVRGGSKRVARRKIYQSQTPASTSTHTMSRRKRKLTAASSTSRRNVNADSGSGSGSGSSGDPRSQPQFQAPAPAPSRPSTSANASAKAAPYVCQTCGRTYQVLGTLTRHMRKECNQPKKYVCRMCGRGFHYNFKLQDHYYYVHKGAFKRE